MKDTRKRAPFSPGFSDPAVFMLVLPGIIAFRSVPEQVAKA